MSESMGLSPTSKFWLRCASLLPALQPVPLRTTCSDEQHCASQALQLHLYSQEWGTTCAFTVSIQMRTRLIVAHHSTILRWHWLHQGHMVPMDKPEAALDMITRFTSNQPLGNPSGQGPTLELAEQDAPANGRIFNSARWLRLATN